MPIGLLIGGLGAVVGGVGSAIAGGQAAGAQRYAADIQKQMYDETVAREAPFVSLGGGAANALTAGLGLGPGGTGQGWLDAPFNPSMLENTPGYKFELGQGEQAITDTATARGGVGGGNTLKALTQYGQGLASTTYQQQLQDYMAQQAQAGQMLYNTAALGSNAASNSATGASSFANSIGNNIAGAGASSAAGTLGIGNAINGFAQNYLLYNSLNNGGGGGGWNFGSAGDS